MEKLRSGWIGLAVGLACAACGGGAGSAGQIAPANDRSPVASPAETVPVASEPVALTNLVTPVTELAGAERQGLQASIVTTVHDGRRRIVAAFRDVADAENGGTGLGYAYSDDDGTSWTRSVVPARSGWTEVGAMMGAPALAVADTTTTASSTDSNPPELYYVALAARRDGTQDDVTHPLIAIARSLDGGVTFLPTTTAAAPEVDDIFAAASSPSIAVDAAGQIHVAFVSDRGTPAARIQHWIGLPTGRDCNFSCMDFFPASAPTADDAIAAQIDGVIVRSWRMATYILYRVRGTPEATTPFADGEYRLVLQRFDPFRVTWEPTDAQPNDGNWILSRSTTLAVGDNVSVSSGAAVDFAIDASSNTGYVAWAGGEGGEADRWGAIFVQAFHITSTISETSSRPAPVSVSRESGMAFQPALAVAPGSASITWLQQDASTGRVALWGSVFQTANANWVPPVNLSFIGSGGLENDMPVCAASPDAWNLQTAAVAFPDPSGDTGLVTLRLHLQSAQLDCGGGSAGSAILGSTRWKYAE